MSTFNSGFYNTVAHALPQQMIPLKEKLKPGTDSEKSFCEQTMDALEQIGRQQYQENLRLIENYEMIKGRFIFDHYFQTEGYDSSLTKLAAELELPNYLRHYDIISPVVNTLSGEYQKRPDTFRVRQMGEDATNEYLRTEQELFSKYVFGKINAEINQRLLNEGMDPEKADFNSEEEAAQYKQQIDQFKEQLTPPQIKKFMSTDFATQAEIWGEHQRQFSREYFNLAEKEKLEFEDMCIADRCFRHYFLTPGGVGWAQESWNPVNTFLHVSPDVNRAEYGDYIGRVLYLSLNTILDRFGSKMNKKDFDMLSGESARKKSKWNDSKFDWVYDNYFVPFQGYPAYDLMRNAWNVSPNSSGAVPQLDNSFFSKLSSGDYFNERPGYYFVTEGYWMSQKRLYKITYIDDEIGEIVVKIVDENYIIPKDFTESKNPFADEHDLNTYVETWIPEVWKGIKVGTAADQNLKKDIYLDCGPNDFQFKGDENLYGSKLPVCGQIFSVRNSRSMSLVDMMKPHQIGYNVAMNQLYQLAEKEVGMFVVMDVNMFPDAKDWGGEDAWTKWMLMAKNMGMLPADTSPNNIQSSLAATGGFLPKVINLDLASQMVSRMNMAKFYEEQAMKQVGFNQYRLGSFAQTSTAAGVEQGRSASYNQTESYFTNFTNYLRRCTSMGLEMAQFVQGQRDSIEFTYTKGDLSQAFMRVNGTKVMLAELGILVSNSQEYIRQLEMARQYALSNNTTNMSPVDTMDIIMLNSPQEIRRQLQASLDKLESQQAQQQQQQQAIGEEQNRIQAYAIEKMDKQFQDKLDNNIDVANIKEGAKILSSDNDEPAAPDNTSAMVSRQNSMDSNAIQSQKLRLMQEKQTADNQYRERDLSLKQAKLANDLEIQRQESISARLMSGKKDK